VSGSKPFAKDRGQSWGKPLNSVEPEEGVRYQFVRGDDRVTCIIRESKCLSGNDETESCRKIPRLF